jgi:peptidoglycan/xylan/chitin deacetylase (PgdA/CDA1 family)
MDNPALVSLTFDDGLRCQFDRALPILKKHRFLATFFLTANPDPTHERWCGHVNDWRKIDWSENDIAMLKGLVRDGHEIGSHSVTHNPTTMPKQPEIEARESKRLIEGWIGTPVSSFCYPYYVSHGYLCAAVKNAGYEQARGGCRAAHYLIPDNGSLDRFNVDCREISNDENISDWVRPGHWHILTFHGIGDEHDGWKHISEPEFDRQMGELAMYQGSGAVEVVTFKDGAARLWRV